MTPKTTKVLLADDHAVLREGLRALLEQEPGMEVVGEAADGRTAVALTTDLRPHVVVMDIGMPDLSGVEATRQIAALSSGPRVLCLSVHREASMVQAMLEAGASGYLLKTSASRELLDAVRAVAAGETYLSPPIAGQVVSRHVRGGGSPPTGGAYGDLTPREREVLQLIAEGKHTKAVARELGISPKTVLAHREKVMKKLDIDSVAGLVRYAIREGVSEL
jgi:DNA-binding NarL/FixJ family response regulator